MMGPVSQWAAIEPAVETPTSVGPEPVDGHRGATVTRIKRQDRLVLGSIDEAAHVFQRHTREVVLGSAVFLVPAIVVNLVVSTLLFDRFTSFEHDIVSLPELIGGIDAATGVETLLAYIGIVCTSLATALIGGYLATVFVRVEFGEPVTLRACLRATLRRLPALLGAWLIGHGWMLLVAWAMVAVSGRTLAPWLVLIVPAGFVVVVFALFVSPVVVIERRGSLGAIGRAMGLVRARFGAAILFLCAAGIIGLGLRFGITFLPRLAQATGLVTFGSYGWLVEGVAGQLAQLIATPLVALATVAFYVQLRVHLEGMDITVAADRAFPGSASTGPAVGGSAAAGSGSDGSPSSGAL
jgi:hypothetical protein